MTRPVSLQRRLGLSVAIAMAATWLIATGFATLAIRHELDEAYDSALQETAQRLLPLAVLDITEREPAAGARRVSPMADHEEFLTYLVRAPSGSVLMQSHDADPRAFPPTPETGFRTTATHRIYGESAVSGGVIIEVAEPLTHRHEATLEAAAALLLPLAALVPLAAIGAWWLVRASLRPLRGFQDEVEARGGGNLRPLPLTGLPEEARAIGTSVNRLIERLGRVLEAERNFTANSAHELRTPVAAALAQTQRLIAELPDGAAARRARHVEASLGDLARLCEKLLQLARAEGGGLLAATPQALGPVLEHVVLDLARTTAVEGRLKLSTPASEIHGSRMDPDAFGILARNLIENALKHGERDGPVEVTFSETGLLRVINDGPVVDPEALQRISRRFERGRAGVGGAGLGLAIADLIASGAGARLELRSPATARSGGFEAIVDLAATGGPRPSS